MSEPPATGKAPAIAKLLEISGEPLAGSITELPRASSSADSARSQVDRLLQAKNGFLAFESALLVLPTRATRGVPGLGDWNALDGWRRHYDGLSGDILFFALDLFCGQFGVSTEGVVRLDPEYGRVEIVARDVEEWASRVLADYDFETGWSLAHEWQARTGALTLGSRLLGRKPFVLGGEYEVANLVERDLADAAEKLGQLYGQIRDLPDGAEVTLVGWV